MDKLAYLQRLARRWGGAIVVLDADRYTDVRVANVGCLLDAPFIDGHCLDWKKRTLYVRRPDLRMHAVIHELGHLFATNVHPNNERCDELTWLGWEYTLARRLRVVTEWREDCDQYGMGYLADSREMGDLTEREFRAAMRKAIKIATRRGIVDGNQVLAVKRRST